ncbi:hypothetical protein NIES2109_27220 [Nostoc sp. HK-01]|uniref:Protein-glutamine gamma-glutamyltransferase-like C-terminal domain-containing protein n=1 Tax=Nostoc cycadae WK-1 TaxID=1861711 RepID=A0A2H6LGR9_9NOSO|nr:DUF4129 domain-containing protein [Nostoc cycadae]BBD59930.1 hypothetical protein NIES2109_27220 [Nostoc sp. HK-01]GBE92412.1 hypothetical protein NCWK1_2167 [Nostoc cycadae WK-1]
MSTDTFEKTSWSWEVSQFQQQIGEWIEYQFDRFQNSVPNLSPDWKISPWLSNLLILLFWLILAVFLAFVAWRLWQEFSPYIYSWLSGGKDAADAAARNRVNDLSVALLLERSQEFYRQGNYREACRCLYLAILQHLHDIKLVPHKFSRTDGEYLQVLRSTVTPIQPYETLITTHEQLCFGNAEILPENYQQCQQAYQEIINQQHNSALNL